MSRDRQKLFAGAGGRLRLDQLVMLDLLLAVTLELVEHPLNARFVRHVAEKHLGRPVMQVSVNPAFDHGHRMACQRTGENFWAEPLAVVLAHANDGPVTIEQVVR